MNIFFFFFFCINVEALEKLQAYDKEVWSDYVNKYNFSEFTDPNLRRRFQNMALLGIAAMETESLSQV